ncbi:MAG: DNA polymerase III subunit gamma/tau [Ignavibacteria bacterium]|nr:DNA polymerase III subunit gamma/tau [Ignavibacteria bacterium]
MSNFVVTARKWRPQLFKDVVGQEHITSTLKNAIKEKRIAHAYLFTGPRGVGKTTTARILAKTLNCENQINSEPCNECEMCKSIQNSQLIDIIEIDAASNRGIDEIRTLRDSVKYAPTRGKYKVYIIDEVHMLTKESFNAFLKTLEEPPEHIIFIFATTDVHKLPLTIISRCQRYDFRRIQLDKIKETLRMIADEEKIKIDDKTLTIIAKKADGALRDAESYFDQVVAFSKGKIDADLVTQMLNLIDEELYFNISDAVIEKDFKVVFHTSQKIYENGWDFRDFIEGLIEHFRNILSTAVTNSTNSIETADIYKERYVDYKGKFSESDILRILNFLNKSQQELRFSQNQKLKIELILSHLIALESTKTISELISEVSFDNSELFKSAESSKAFYKPAETVKKKVDSSATTKKGTEPQKTNSSSYIASPSQQPNFSFDDVVNKWGDFIHSINSEKGLTLGPALKGFNLLSLKDNNLFFSTEKNEDLNTFRLNEKYIAKKSEEFFGRRFNFIVSNQLNSIPEKNKVDNAQESKQTNSTDLYEEIIINELGGEKIA